MNIHDLHVWQLGDGMSIGTIHISCQRTENPQDYDDMLSEVKGVFHKYGVHSTTVQPEFVSGAMVPEECLQNCVEECEEDWCCKDTIELQPALSYSTFNNNVSNSVNAAPYEDFFANSPPNPGGYNHIV